MGSMTLSPAASPPKAWSDSRLVRDCLKGREEAWAALVDKYKNLIYSIPIKYGLAPDEAADIFQSVCLETLSRLETLREPGALPKWLMQVAAHKCYHFKRQQSRIVSFDEDSESCPPLGAPVPDAEAILREVEREQSLREAIAALQPRCAQLVEMLFFEEPAVPYAEAAKRLGIATGSIGFIRGRCLKQLRKRLEARER
ncbi:MAG TPA: sigma-70 family RNA polymerase sigma factor [Candidatus Acidoferrales bacterium]|nr:sigma-70 family RNA polymerase sigma factor [Candidatus Acidoferrales bacterium]